MQNIGDIRHRMRGISETRQITRAMYLISTAKMKKAMERFNRNSAYVREIRAAMTGLLRESAGIRHPFLDERSGNRAAMVVAASDKGLCGSYNHNVLNAAAEYIRATEQTMLYTVGYMAKTFFERRNIMVDVEFLYASQNPSLYYSRLIAEDLIDLFQRNLVDRVMVCYTRFYSPVSQEPTIIQLLPLALPESVDVDRAKEYRDTMIYHPDPGEVFDTLVPQYVIGMIYSALVQSSASEHSARMTAMDSATRNASEMLDKLRLQYNRARQFAITQEISEIVGGAQGIAR